jgi:hypothetical protein
VNDLIQLKIFEPEADYETVKEWWEGHGWNALPAVMLPKLGVMAFTEQHGLAAGWLYMDNSCGVCMLEWLVTNPEVKGTGTVRGLKHVCEFLTKQAKSFGYTIMLTTCRQDSLARFHERNGFQTTDSEMIHLVKLMPKGEA